VCAKLAPVLFDDLATFTIAAANLPEHARNPIHTDDGAQAAGFPRALVAGVTTYAYLTHPMLAGWGAEWLATGGAEVRFRRPVFDGDVLRCVPVADGERITIEAHTDEPEQPRAVVDVTDRAAAATRMRDGEVLRPIEIELSGEWGSQYASRAGDALPLCDELGVVHPAVWPALANNVVHTQVARGSWIHTRSVVRHHGLAAAGSTALVRATVVRRFTAHGERAVLDVEITVDGAVVATLEHEAIIALP